MTLSSTTLLATSDFTANSPNTPSAEPTRIADVPSRVVGDEGLRIERLDGTNVRVDGRIDEEQWHAATVQNRFYVIDPDTRELADLATQLRIFFDDRGLYIAAVMEQDPQSLVQRLSARDQGFLNRDYVSISLDTSGEGRYGYWFQLNLGDSRSDGTIQPERQFSDSWDGAWYGATARTATGWSAEFLIPWSITSMPAIQGERIMGLFAQRKIAYRDSRVAWPALPFTEPKFLSAFQPMVFDEVQPRQQFNVFPYISSLHDQMGDASARNHGIDMFWRPSSNFQITGTARPDFGTVEADSVVINLTAVETFFPEKRLFFLEGQEIFVPTGRSQRWSSGTPIILLHTRRIGSRPYRPHIPSDAEFDQEQFRRPSDLLGALKTTGQIGALRYGVFSAREQDSRFHGSQNGESIEISQPGRDFSSVRLLAEKSNGNYRGLGFMSTRMDHPEVGAQTHAVDGKLNTADGKFNIESQVLMSDVDGEDNGYGGFIDLAYAPSTGISHSMSYEVFDDEINLRHMGYLPRNDIEFLRYSFRARRYPEAGIVKESSFRVSAGQGWNSDGLTVRSGLSVSQEWEFRNQTEFRIRVTYDPTRHDDLNSFGNGAYRLNKTRDVNLRYSTDTSKRLYTYLGVEWEEEHIHGDSYSASTAVLWRPSDRLAMSFNISYRDRDGWLLFRGDRNFTTFATESWSPRMGVDFFLTAKQHFRFDLDWRGIRAEENAFFKLPEEKLKLVEVDESDAPLRGDFGISRMNLQLRYRWELAPMSDLFVVYTRNANLPNAISYSAREQFTETFDHPTAEALAIKLRHRIGS